MRQSEKASSNTAAPSNATRATASWWCSIDPVPVENPALQAVRMALEMRDAIATLTETWRRWGHHIGFGIGIAHGFATLGTIGFEGRFDYAAIGTVSNVASRLCDEAKPGHLD